MKEVEIKLFTYGTTPFSNSKPLAWRVGYAVYEVVEVLGTTTSGSLSELVELRGAMRRLRDEKST